MTRASPALRTRLVSLVLALLLPVIVISAIGAYLLWRSDQRSLERELTARASALADDVERQLDTAQAVLETLATSPSLINGDTTEFRRQIDMTPQTHGRIVVLSDRTGRVLLNSLFPQDKHDVPPRQADLDTSNRVFETGEAQVSDLHVGPLTGDALIAVHVPVQVGGAIAYDLSLGFRPTEFEQLLQQQGLPRNDWVASLLDSKLTFIARTARMSEVVGSGATSAARTALTSASAGIFSSAGIEGRAILGGFTRLPQSHWTAVVAVRQEGLFARLRNSLALVTLLGAAAAVIGLIAALRQSRIIAASIVGLVEHPAAQTTTGVREADLVAEALARAAADRQAAERELTTLLGSLEKRVQDEVSAREQAQERLRHAERMQALGQLAGGVAHDFNNVLQAIQGSASLLLHRYGQEEKLRRYAGLIIEASERGAGITQRLLAFSSRGDLRSSHIEPAALLREMGDMLTHTLGSGITIGVSADPSLPALVADKRQLETVLINLATNARDAMSSNGTLTLTAIERRSGDSHLPALLTGGPYIEIAVADTGIGMTGDVLARATEPFFTTKEIGRGTGLGLAMARGFTEQSGGTLDIESTPGQGTTVRLWLPVVEAEADSTSDQAPQEEQVAPRPRLLLVDDEEMVREVLSAQLEDAGYFVSAAPSAEEALSLLNMVQVDLLVTDLSMPGMNGVSLIRAVHHQKPELPAVLLTGFATEAAQLLTTQELDRALLLRKPIDGRVLAERIADLLERTRVAS